MTRFVMAFFQMSEKAAASGPYLVYIFFINYDISDQSFFQGFVIIVYLNKNKHNVILCISHFTGIQNP